MAARISVFSSSTGKTVELEVGPHARYEEPRPLVTALHHCQAATGAARKCALLAASPASAFAVILLISCSGIVVGSMPCSRHWKSSPASRRLTRY
jgi:hypothetical protein